MLSEELRAQGWIEHDGESNPFDGKPPQWVKLAFAERGILKSTAFGRSDMYDTCWKWAKRWYRPERPVQIIAYKPETPDGR